jgi:hypothetical protein
MIFSELESILNLIEKGKKFLFRKAKASNPTTLMLKKDKPQNHLTESSNERVPNQIAKRIELALGMITDEKGEKFPLSWFGEYLGMERPGDLERIVLNEIEPTFQVLNHLADHLGINPSWLKSGQGEPFQIRRDKPTYSEEYFEEIVALKPTWIFFVRRTIEEGEAIIVLKLTKLKYRVLPNVYHISDRVGGTGRRQIDGLCRLIEKLRITYPKPHMIGLEVEKKELFDLHQGKIHPSWLDRNCLSKKSDWWDDITDIMHESPISENYENLYGEAFVQAQRIVRFERTGNLDIIKR